MFAQTTHCVQISYSGFGGDDMDLLGLMLVSNSPDAISFAIKCMMEGGVECALGLMQRLWPSGRGI